MVKQTKRGRVADRARKAKFRPRKRFKKGLGGKGDWARHWRGDVVKHNGHYYKRLKHAPRRTRRKRRPAGIMPPFF
jgi:hypothetical protein